MIEPKPTSRFFVAMLNVCIFSAMAVGLSIGLLAYFLTPLPTLKIATEYPLENMAIIAVAEEVSPGEFQILSSGDSYTVKEGAPDAGGSYIDLKQDIDQYDHVVTVEHPRRNQVVFREKYPIDLGNGKMDYKEILVYGDRRIQFIGPYDRPQEEQ